MNWLTKGTLTICMLEHMNQRIAEAKQMIWGNKRSNLGQSSCVSDPEAA